MSNKDYYDRWLKLKKQMEAAVAEDQRLQELATTFVGIKPQATAVEIVSRVYCKYCDIYNKLCDCYDQMEQVQRRPYIKTVIDAVTCRLLELKSTLEQVEVFEFTYPDNALQQLLIVPQDIQIMCPFFYPFEIRQQEMQYIIDQIFAGNRIGDPEPTPSENERAEEERLENERQMQEAKEAEVLRKLALGEDVALSSEDIVLSPEEKEAMRLQEEYERHINNIQRMERSRVIISEKTHKINTDLNLYLELAGLKKPQPNEKLKQKAAKLIQLVYRQFMQLKRDRERDNKVKHKLGMILPSWRPESAKVQLEKVKEDRRNYRRKYYMEWMDKAVKEKSRVLRLREGDIMEDISAEITQWFKEWYFKFKVFDEFPWPDEGGSILVVQGNTFTLEEYVEYRDAEDKRLKAEAGSPKTKEQIKQEKMAAREEKRRIDAEAKIKQKKKELDYKKSRLNPDNDPGIYIKIGTNFQPVLDAWLNYECQWKEIDTADAPLNAIKGYIAKLITENAYHDIQLELRPIVDEMMRLELKLLQKSLKTDYNDVGIANPPTSKKRKKPKKVKAPRPDKVSPAAMFQLLVDEGIVRKYPKTTLDDYWGDQNFAAADLRAVPWTPSFPPPGMGDVREQVKIRSLLTLGCNCPGAARSQLLVGPKFAGKQTLVYAVATETNAILIDLSPMNVYNKFPGPKNLKTMFTYVNKISKMMQPTVILVNNADRLCYKKVPKEEKMFDPTRLQRDFFKEVIKPIGSGDKILVMGTASEPWIAKTSAMYKIFPSTILIPRTDYASISFILTNVLMKYHAVNREFDVHSVAQTLKGYDLKSIRNALDNLLSYDRVVALSHKPLQPVEILQAVMDYEGCVYTDDFDAQMFKEWYEGYCPMGAQNLDYMIMLDSQLTFKMKADKKKKQA